MKLYLIIILLLFLIISSCDDPEQNSNNADNESSIKIIYPENNSDWLYLQNAIQIIAVIENKELINAAYIEVNDNIITSGLSDTLIAYYEPPSNLNESISIEATLKNDNNEEIGYDNITIFLNTLDSNTLSSETIFMNIDDQFQMMRFPVTNQQFVDFLNSNQQIEIKLGEILWTDSNNDSYGDPTLCELDVLDNYEPLQWWYVNVASNFANEIIPAGDYTIYKNGYNPYDFNADFSEQGGKIKYDCQNQRFIIEEEYLNHPVTGVTWVGANIYANYFGWSIPSIEQWELAAKANYDWEYPWGNNIDKNYANYNNTTTTEIGKYNGVYNQEEDIAYNLSLSAYGLYDMGGNVWEHISSFHPESEIYLKTGGSFDTDTLEIKIGYTAYSILEHVSNNTGFRCIVNNSYISPPASGCMDINACNYDAFSQISDDCFENDCLEICGGIAEEYQFFEDTDNDGFGNPDVSQIQCDVPENGWCDNSNDLDDTCPSSDINQENIDCNSECNGNAYIDGCGECVGGNTGQEECSQDCNGVDGGEANWDDCDICSGGETDLDPNQDLDCNGVCDPLTPQGEIDANNGLQFGAFIDECGYCVEGGTNLEENFADLGCGCDEAAAQYYCVNEVEDNCVDGDFCECCDCVGGEADQGWENCELDTDVNLICEDDLQNTDLEVIFGCSNNNAENYYCDQEENECITFGVSTLPPCNFIDDGTCIVYGCSDPTADNYWEEATECDDGSLDNCCVYTTPLQVSFGSIDSNLGTMEINIIVPEYENESDYIYGFQFNINGVTLSGASGGMAEEAGFTISVGGSTIIGFSLSGDYIGQGEGLLTTVDFNANDNQACFDLGTGAFSNQNSQSIPVEFGECYDF